MCDIQDVKSYSTSTKPLTIIHRGARARRRENRKRLETLNAMYITRLPKDAKHLPISTSHHPTE